MGNIVVIPRQGQRERAMNTEAKVKPDSLEGAYGTFIFHTDGTTHRRVSWMARTDSCIECTVEEYNDIHVTLGKFTVSVDTSPERIMNLGVGDRLEQQKLLEILAKAIPALAEAHPQVG